MTPAVTDRDLEAARRPRRSWPVQRILLVFAAALVALSVVTAVYAQGASGWDLSWGARGSGGGHSGSGAYSVEGSIGQSIVGHSSGGGYAIDTGFLGGVLQLFRLVSPFLASDGS